LLSFSVEVISSTIVESYEVICTYHLHKLTGKNIIFWIKETIK